MHPFSPLLHAIHVIHQLFLIFIIAASTHFTASLQPFQDQPHKYFWSIYDICWATPIYTHCQIGLYFLHTTTE